MTKTCILHTEKPGETQSRCFSNSLQSFNLKKQSEILTEPKTLQETYIQIAYFLWNLPVVLQTKLHNNKVIPHQLNDKPTHNQRLEQA